MMQNKIQLVVLLAGILSKVSGDLYQFVLINKPKTWTEAQSYCRENYIDLATVQSDEDRAKLKEAANTVNFQSVAWIGFYSTFWRWSYQNTPVSNVKWDTSQPDLSDTNEACGNVNKYGRWSDRYCTDKDAFFCQTDNQSTLQDKFKHIKGILLSWHDAQIHCRTHYTDLATITDDTENTHLANELFVNGHNDAWIGLYKNLPQWQWSDKTSVWWSSVKWESGKPDNVNRKEVCARADTDGQLDDDTCSTPLPFYCSENRKIQRVRFTLKSDGLLDESAVMEAIEKKMKDMKSRFKITWSVQPDGKIFQQQKTQENTQETACEVLDPKKR